jgi:hypothetical protein
MIPLGSNAVGRGWQNSATSERAASFFQGDRVLVVASGLPLLIGKPGRW